jgi:hypothetical protein
MSNRKPRKGGRQPRRVSVRGVRRDEPDARRLGRALIAYALQEAAAEAAAEAETKQRMKTAKLAKRAESSPVTGPAAEPGPGSAQ